MELNIKDTFNKELPADPIIENYRRQVSKSCFSYTIPKKTAKSKMLHVSSGMLSSLGISEKEAQSEEFLKIFTGNDILPNTKPFAMCYGGHQFGNWAGQLGDGRAINLAEIVHQDKRWAIQLKGGGETPYSRTADGLAVLRSSIREYLCSESMYHLGVSTTRALSLALTGDQVMRDVLYDGNSAYEKGAIVCRVAPTFIRFGNFGILASRGDKETLKSLTDYTIKYFFPHIKNNDKGDYLQFFKEVVDANLKMVIHWQRVGFVHGVMNTDNMSILGLTIDYGPYGWLEGYDHGWTPNTTDHQYKRYRYGNQPDIVLWNLYQLANAIYPLIEEVNGLEKILENYRKEYSKQYLQMMRSKIGLFVETVEDELLIQDLKGILQLIETDMTLFFRNLNKFDKNQPSDGLKMINDAFYVESDITEGIKQRWEDWFLSYASRLQKEVLSKEERVVKMNAINPKYILRNYMAQLAINAADRDDYSVIEELFNLLKNPYDEQPENKKWFAKRPEWARHKVGCSMLSCSS